MTERALHLDDGALVRLLDGEPLPGDGRGHLGACSACQARLGSLRARSAGLDRAFAAARVTEPAPPADLWQRIEAAVGSGDPATLPKPGAAVIETEPAGHPRTRRAGLGRRRWRTPLARAAAVVGVLITGALAAEPVRAWLAEGVERSWNAIRRAAPSAGPAPVEEPASSIVVSFVPAGNRLVIRIDAAQRKGTVRVSFEDRRDAVGEVLTPDEGTSLLVLPDGFRARNHLDSEGDYRFRVPRSLESVVVEVAGTHVAEWSAMDGVVEIGIERP